MGVRDHEICAGRYAQTAPLAPEEREKFIELWRKWLSAPPNQAQSQEPGIVQKISNFTRALAKWKAAGSLITPPGKLEERRAICHACEYRDPIRDVCTHKHCGCNLEGVGLIVSMVTGAPGKLLMATEECPAGKWSALI